MTVKEVKEWSNNHISTFAWQRILFRHMLDFREYGLYLQHINNDTVLENELLKKLNQTFVEVYNTPMPTNFIVT